jgi:DNA-directed RNA polymerase specialized sigma24 family protein
VGDVEEATERERVVARPRHDVEAIYRESAPALARAIYAYSGGRRHVTEDAVAEAFARVNGSTITDLAVVDLSPTA